MCPPPPDELGRPYAGLGSVGYGDHCWGGCLNRLLNFRRIGLSMDCHVRGICLSPCRWYYTVRWKYTVDGAVCGSCRVC